MNQILVPINFSAANEHTLRFAHAISEQLGWGIDLLYCFPVQTYNRKYDFGQQAYQLGIQEMLADFYHKNLPDSAVRPNFHALSGSAVDNIAAMSAEYYLVLISSSTFSEKTKKWLGSRASGIVSSTRCPVLIVPPGVPYNAWEKIWHIKRRDTEVLTHRLNKLKINPQLVQVKTLIQKTFTSTIWQKIVSYNKAPQENMAEAVQTAEFEAEVDLIIIVCHQQESFLQFLRSGAMQMIFQFPVPILIFPMRKLSQRNFQRT